MLTALARAAVCHRRSIKEPFRQNFLWAGLCIMGAVFFIFREQLMGGY